MSRHAADSDPPVIEYPMPADRQSLDGVGAPPASLQRRLLPRAWALLAVVATAALLVMRESDWTPLILAVGVLAIARVALLLRRPAPRAPRAGEV